MTPTPNPPAPQGEERKEFPFDTTSNFPAQLQGSHGSEPQGWPPITVGPEGEQAQRPSAPKAEQVPQEVLALAERIIMFAFRKETDGQEDRAEAAALIFAERERHSDQLRRELEQTTQTIARAEKERIEHSQQLAALQRENDALKKQLQSTRDHSIALKKQNEELRASTLDYGDEIG